MSSPSTRWSVPTTPARPESAVGPEDAHAHPDALADLVSELTIAAVGRHPGSQGRGEERAPGEGPPDLAEEQRLVGEAAPHATEC